VFLVVLPRSVNRRKRTGLVASPDARFHSQLAVDSAACILCHGVQFAFKLTESFSALLCIFDQHLVTVLLKSRPNYETGTLTTNYNATRVFAALCVIFAEGYPTRKSGLSNVSVNPFLEMK
jgi:hypothetical protein